MKKRFLILTLALCALVCGAGCNSNNSSQDYISSQSGTAASVTSDNTTITAPLAATALPKTTAAPTTEAPTLDHVAMTDYSDVMFNYLSTKTFVHTSGSENWDETLYVSLDGSFKGHFHDYEGSEKGEYYPYGTEYEADYTGRFYNVHKVESYVYLADYTTLNYSDQSGAEYTLNGVKHISTESVVFTNLKKKQIYIILPGIPVERIPKKLKEWLPDIKAGTHKSETLGYWAVYNQDDKLAFTNYDPNKQY